MLSCRRSAEGRREDRQTKVCLSIFLSEVFFADKSSFPFSEQDLVVREKHKKQGSQMSFCPEDSSCLHPPQLGDPRSSLSGPSKARLWLIEGERKSEETGRENRLEPIEIQIARAETARHIPGRSRHLSLHASCPTDRSDRYVHAWNAAGWGGSYLSSFLETNRERKTSPQSRRRSKQRTERKKARRRLFWCESISEPFTIFFRLFFPQETEKIR